jgi:hypothetical protein
MLPGFVDQLPKNSSKAESKRQLVPLSQIDVHRDILKLNLVVNSNVEPEEIEFKLSLQEWNSTGMEVFINFTDPLQISKGVQFDRAIC